MEQHGMCNTKLYRIWDNMKSRCNNPKHKSYGEYGGRGIRVCDEWNSFVEFMAWALQNGYQEELTIDRVDNDLGYCPENCKWSTQLEQARNRRTNAVVTINGVSHTLTEWEEITGISAHTIGRRVKAGWKSADAIFMPERKIERHNKSYVSHNSRSVIRLNDGTVYKSTTEAAEASGIDNSSVVKVCKGKRGSTRGWRFRYLNPQQAVEGERDG